MDEQERKRRRVEATIRCRAKDPEKYRVYMRNYLRKKYPEMRDAVLEKLGKFCAKCGYDNDERALQIDHIDGQGRRERRRIGWYKFYNKILADSTNYQILCCNCNYIKRYTNNEVYVVDKQLTK